MQPGAGTTKTEPGFVQALNLLADCALFAANRFLCRILRKAFQMARSVGSGTKCAAGWNQLRRVAVAPGAGHPFPSRKAGGGA